MCVCFLIAPGRVRSSLFLNNENKKVLALAYFCRNLPCLRLSRNFQVPSSLAAPSFRCSFIADTFLSILSHFIFVVLLHNRLIAWSKILMEWKHSVACTQYCTDMLQLLRLFRFSSINCRSSESDILKAWLSYSDFFFLIFFLPFYWSKLDSNFLFVSASFFFIPLFLHTFELHSSIHSFVHSFIYLFVCFIFSKVTIE